MSGPDPDLPWTIEEDMLSKSDTQFENSSVDLVIARYLMSGDTRPLAWFLLKGHKPAKHLLRYLGVMLAPGDTSKVQVPYELCPKARNGKRGRPKKGPEQKLRDWLLFHQVSQLMELRGQGTYDAAIAEVAQLQGLEHPTVKRAYDCIKKLMDQAGSSK